ncbi:MAG: hypothetical protein WBX22_03125, partial [Silvibacterium sp.]
MSRTAGGRWQMRCMSFNGVRQNILSWPLSATFGSAFGFFVGLSVKSSSVNGSHNEGSLFLTLLTRLSTRQA